MKQWKKICYVNSNQEEIGIVIAILDKIDFKWKIVKRDKGHYILIKDQLRRHNTQTSELQNIWSNIDRIEERNCFIKLVGDLSTLLSVVNNTSINQLYYTYFSRSYEEFPRINHRLGHKTFLSTF